MSHRGACLRVARRAWRERKKPRPPHPALTSIPLHPLTAQVSSLPYDEELDEKMGSNKIVIANEDFSKVSSTLPRPSVSTDFLFVCLDVAEWDGMGWVCVNVWVNG